MKKYTALTIWTLIAHSLVMFAGGHGVGNIFLMEFMFLAGRFGLEDIAKRSWHLPVEIIFTFVGQVLVIICLFKKHPHTRILKSIGLGLLFVSVVSLSLFVFTWNTLHVTLSTAIPFLVCAIVLLFKTWRPAKNEFADSFT